MNGAASVRKALEEARLKLSAAGVEAPAREARLLLERTAGVRREDQLAHPDRRLDPEALGAFLQAVARRAAREPLAYIVGEKEFFGLTLAVRPGVLIPRPESEVVVELALARRPPSVAWIADIGTGSGCLLIAALNELREARGVGTDLAPAALDVARQNARRLGVAARALFVCGRFGEAISGRIDLLLANLPYVARSERAALPPEVRDFEPELALDGGADGLEALRLLIPDLPRLLRPLGLAVLEVGRGQAGAVAGLLREAGLETVEIRPDLAGIPRAVAARRPERVQARPRRGR